MLSVLSAREARRSGQRLVSNFSGLAVSCLCRNATVSAFRLVEQTFTGTPFRLQNICRNGVPARSGTTTPLAKTVSLHVITLLNINTFCQFFHHWKSD